MTTPAEPIFRREGYLVVAFIATAVAGWELTSRAGVISTLFFPPPSVVFGTIVDSFRDGTLVAHTAATLGRVALGVGIGAAMGLALGLAMGWSVRLRALVDPLVALVHPLPKLALLPLVMMLFGVGEASRIVVIAIAAFFPMLISAMSGVRQIHPVAFETAQAYGARPHQVFTSVVLPGSLPMVLTGTRLAFNIGLLLAVAVELVSAQDGLGKMVWLAWQTLRTEELYAALVVLAGLGVGFNALLQRVTRRVVPWREERGR